MAVPGASANYLRNTTGGAFSAQTQGGTLLGNDKASVPASPVANLFPLRTNATEFPHAPYPVTGAATNPWGQKVISGSTGGFAYQGVGEYQIMTISTKIAGDSSTKVLITGADSNLGRHAIHQFQHDYGADTMALMRANRYSRTGFLDDGTTRVGKRSANLWLDAAGNAYEVPATKSAGLPWAPGGSARNGSGATAANTDAAANPTRAIPGRLVMKANFVAGELDPWTATTNGGSDFYVYKAITGC